MTTTDIETVRNIDLENVHRHEITAAQDIATSLEALIGPAHWAFLHFYHADCANSAIHTAPVRFSPLTFRLAEALWGLTPDGGEIGEVLAHRGSYPEDPGRE